MIKSLLRIKHRHGGYLPSALAYEVFIRAWRKPILRALMRPLLPARRASRYVFLLGCYNSGTTVVKDAIALHPDVVTTPVEGDVLTLALPNFEAGGWPRAMYGHAPTIVRERRSGLINRARIESDWRPWLRPDRVMVEKSISDSVRIEQLRSAFPGSRFICITRSPDAVVRGIQKRSHPGRDASWLLGSTEYDRAFLLSQWHYIYRLILKDARDDDTLFFAYDDFIASPDESLQALYRFLGLSIPAITFVEGCLRIEGRSLSIRPHRRPMAQAGDARAQLIETLQQFHPVTEGQPWLPESS